eukprot:5106592-Prymnesium_polylepis.1
MPAVRSCISDNTMCHAVYCGFMWLRGPRASHRRARSGGEGDHHQEFARCGPGRTGGVVARVQGPGWLGTGGAWGSGQRTSQTNDGASAV